MRSPSYSPPTSRCGHTVGRTRRARNGKNAGTHLPTQRNSARNFDPNTTGWVNGPDDYEFFQIGYRSRNADGKLHDDFSDDNVPQQWCGDEKPKCGTCNGDAANNECQDGDFKGVPASILPLPLVTMCVTTVPAVGVCGCLKALGWSSWRERLLEFRVIHCRTRHHKRTTHERYSEKLQAGINIGGRLEICRTFR